MRGGREGSLPVSPSLESESEQREKTRRKRKRRKKRRMGCVEEETGSKKVSGKKAMDEQDVSKIRAIPILSPAEGTRGLHDSARSALQ